MAVRNELREVRLYGRLGAQFGRTHWLAVRTPAEAAQALCAVLPGFEKELHESGSRGRGIVYAIFLGRRNLSPDELTHDAAEGEAIRIAPIIQGSKSAGVFQTILGAALVAVGAVMWATGIGAPAGVLMMKMGALLALGGVIQMLTPTQNGLSTKDSPDNGASYNFNGAVNTTAQGNCVPVLYGESFCGSAVVSAGVFAEDQT